MFVYLFTQAPQTGFVQWSDCWPRSPWFMVSHLVSRHITKWDSAIFHLALLWCDSCRSKEAKSMKEVLHSSLTNSFDLLWYFYKYHKWEFNGKFQVLFNNLNAYYLNYLDVLIFMFLSKMCAFKIRKIHSPMSICA